MLAGAGLTISAGKMSGLWSGTPASIKLGDLDVICAVVGCGVEELLIAEPGKIGRPAGEQDDEQPAASSSQARPAVTPRRNLSSQMRHQAACVVCGGWSSWGLVAGGSLIHAWAGIWRGRGRRWNRSGWARQAASRVA